MTRLALLTAAMMVCAPAAWAGPISVTNANDSGIGSLRDAINNANAAPDFNDILFSIPGPGPWTIHLISPLPDITSSLSIQGSSAAGYVANTAAPGQPMNGTMRIEIDGSAAGSGAYGIFFGHAANIEGLVINNFLADGVGGDADGIGVSRCYIGTDITGLLPLPNRNGIVLSAADGANISGCLISGNARRGIVFENFSTSTITGNYIGVDKTGSVSLPNSADGIWLNSGSNENTIGFQFVTGCTLPTFGSNVIAFNGGRGIRMGGGVNSDRNRILANFIHSNELLGIDLDADLVTANDNFDADAGNNQDQNYPVLVSRSGNTVYAYLKSAASQTYTVQFYWNASCDDGFGEGQQYLGYKSGLTTDATGLVIFNFTCGTIPAGGFVTALATDANGNTSEFSKCLSSPPTAARDNPAVFALGANMPNPFNPSTVIGYRLAAPERVRIDVFDVTGRRVRTLVDETRGAGPGSVRWNGDDDAGRPVVSGVYFYRMRAGTFDTSRKMVLLK